MDKAKLTLTALALVAALGYTVIALPKPAQGFHGVDPLAGSDSCGHVKVWNVTEDPVCDSRVVSNTNSYKAIAFVSSNIAITNFNWKWDNYWCQDSAHLSTSTTGTSCVQNDNPNSGTISLGANQQYVGIASNVTSPQAPFSYCGTYQDDFYFSYTDPMTGQTCQSTYKGAPHMAAWAYCSTADANGNINCVAPTATGTPTMTPTATPTQTQSNGCDTTNQTGTNNNSNCNNNSNNNSQNQSQTQNNNQTVNISLAGTSQQQQVLGTSTPTQLPSTGAEGDVLFGLLSLIPIGWKIRKLI